MINWINRNKESIIRVAFLVPILSVAIISISHVVSWYNLANPISWAIYLSIAVEIAALSSIAASSVRVKGFSVWFVFIIVTLIQFIGNIYFSYTEINIDSKEFKDWAELTLPIFSSFSDVEDVVAQRRLLAVLEGGLLPLISLTCLHFFIKYGDRDLNQEVILSAQPVDEKTEEPIIDQEENNLTEYSAEENVEEAKESIDEYEKSDLDQEVQRVWDKVKELKEEGMLPPELTEEEKLEEPSALANSSYRNEESIEDNVVIVPASTKPEAPIQRKEVGRGVSLTKRSNTYDNNLPR